MLTIAGERNRDDFTPGPLPLHDDTRILHGEPGTNVAVDPLDLGILVGEAALGDQVEDIRAPVLDGDVLDLGPLHGDQLHDCAVERGGLELRRRATLHVHDLCPLVRDDQGALELTEVLRVDAEVGLKRVLHLHSRRDVDKAAAAEDGGIQRGELVVAARDDLAEPLLEDLRVLLEPLRGSDKDDSLLADCGLDVGIGRLAVELGLHSSEELALLLGDAEALEGFLDVLGDLVPTPLRLLSLREVVADVLEDDILQILGRPVGRHRLLEELAVTLLAEGADPIGIPLHVADIIDRRLGQADAGIVGVVHLVAEIAHGTVDIDVGLGFSAHRNDKGFRL